MDFVSDTFEVSRKFRILAINDDCCRENLCLIADTSTASGCKRVFDHGRLASQVLSRQPHFRDLLAGHDLP